MLTLAAATDGSPTKTSSAKKFLNVFFFSGVDEASVFLGYDAASLGKLTF
jgi:hypothetical protein